MAVAKINGKIVSPVVEKKVPSTKYGLSVENLLPTYNADGTITPAEVAENVEIPIDGVSLPSMAFAYMFAENRGNATNITFKGTPQSIGNECFSGLTSANSDVESVVFDGLIDIPQSTSKGLFYNAFFRSRASQTCIVRFPTLKSVGAYGLYYMRMPYSSNSLDAEDIFPELESITGARAMSTIFVGTKPIVLPKVKTIVGVSTPYDSPFYENFNNVYKFPSLESITGTYVFPKAVTELHFPAAAQDTIEADANYATKWGATNATIYFDL